MNICNGIMWLGIEKNEENEREGRENDTFLPLATHILFVDSHSHLGNSSRKVGTKYQLKLIVCLRLVPFGEVIICLV